MVRENTDESILAVCYTNHALDSFLEDLYDAGERRIVRIGGRSKSDKLKGFNLRELSRRHGRGGREVNTRIGQVVARLHKKRESFEASLEALQKPITWTQPFGGIQEYLFTEHPELLEFLSVPGEQEGYTIIGRRNKRMSEDHLWNLWASGEPFPIVLVPYVDNSPEHEQFWGTDIETRVTLIDRWRREILEPEMVHLKEEVAAFDELLREKQAIMRANDTEILRSARVIGATTTGAAQYRDLLNEKKAGVLIIEEAGEVLEAHVLSSMCEETSHLILIGDHLQLRPKVENYTLTTVSNNGYNLDCSLFERLALSNLPSVRLRVQHRMRPSISSFVRKQTYPDLLDHDSVKEYEDVKGVSKNVVFVDHRILEDGAKEKDYSMAQTRSNGYEAELCIEIVRYLLFQGYSTSDIVVLTPYVGQLLRLMHVMRQNLKEVSAFLSENDQKEIDDMGVEVEGVQPPSAHNKLVRCSSIDNFQGEEAKLIVISLVRSNKQGNIGFLKEPQRVNVLLSRAKFGMFIVGNTETLLASSKGAKVWVPLLETMKENDQIFEGFPTYCQRHPNDPPVLLAEPADFRTRRPNGGCDRPCDFRMECGHVCPMTCHSYDRTHVVAMKECIEPCRRFPPECPLEHPCTRRCNEKCGPCKMPVGPIVQTCGHTVATAWCHEVRDKAAIAAFTARCQVVVEHKFTRCRHQAMIPCSDAKKPDPICPLDCGALLECGHKCRNM